MLFALIHSAPILPELAEGVNWHVLPVFWRFCPIAKSVGARQRPSGQAMREKQRDSGANRAGGDRCRAQARLQTGLENNGAQSVNRLIISLKAAKALADEHVAQILGCLRSSRVEHGLLINFRLPEIRDQEVCAEPDRRGQPPGRASSEELFPCLRLLRLFAAYSTGNCWRYTFPLGALRFSLCPAVAAGAYRRTRSHIANFVSR